MQESEKLGFVRESELSRLTLDPRRHKNLIQLNPISTDSEEDPQLIPSHCVSEPSQALTMALRGVQRRDPSS